MSDLKKKFSDKFWIHVAFFAVALILIVYFVPGRAHKKYAYEVGKPWMSANLYAPAQLTIGYDAATEKMKRDSIKAQFVPYFTHDKDVEVELLKKIEETPILFRNEAREAVKTVFDDGIVDNNIYDSIQSGKLTKVRILEGNVAKDTISTAKMRSAKEAYEYVDSRTHMALTMSTVNFNTLLRPNYVLDAVNTEKSWKSQCQTVLGLRVIDKGESIISRGEKVTAQDALAIQECEKILQAEENTGNHYPILGYTVAVLGLLLLLYCYLYLYRRESILGDRRKLLFVLFMITAMTVAGYALMHRFVYVPMLIPITLIPIVLVTFFDSRTAFFVSVVQVLLCSLVETGEAQLNFIILHLVACIVAIDSLQELTKRSQLLRTAFCVLVAYTVTYAAVRIIEDGNVAQIQWTIILCFVINAVLLSLAYVLIFVFERVFGFVSKVTLVELSDINNPLLLELSEKCPGTFQHSVQLSNLVSEAAREIGANSQLARAGAMYHDIGKMCNPAFFTENQHDVNPHSLLTPEQSAKIVIRHVTDGLRIAEKEKLPAEIRNFIIEHHGKSVTRYFYNTACNNNGGNPVDPAPYTYPGPNPRSKETSLLMMADATEAASRSMKEYNDETISNLVNKIIDGQIAQGLMKDSPLSFRDVETVKKVFIARLRTMYHTRISYPELKKPTQQNVQ